MPHPVPTGHTLWTRALGPKLVSGDTFENLRKRSCFPQDVWAEHTAVSTSRFCLLQNATRGAGTPTGATAESTGLPQVTFPTKKLTTCLKKGGTSNARSTSQSCEDSRRVYLQTPLAENTLALFNGLSSRVWFSFLLLLMFSVTFFLEKRKSKLEKQICIQSVAAQWYSKPALRAHS